MTLSRGDSFNTQEGNIYDFGGYWNYNLGNSYEENHMEQSHSGDSIEAKLNNDDLSRDKAQSGGPDYTTISGLDSHGTNVWVSKNVKGASYDYATEHDSLEVNHKCNTKEYKYGGRTEEYKYTGSGNKTYEMWSEKGNSVETVFDRNTEDVMSYTATSNTGGGKASFDFCFCAKTSAEFQFGISSAFSLSTAASLDINISASAGVKIDFGASAFVGLKGHVGGDVIFDTVTQELDCGFQSFKAQKKALIQAKLESLTLKDMRMEIYNRKVHIVNDSIKLKAGQLGLDTKNICIWT